MDAAGASGSDSPLAPVYNRQFFRPNEKPAVKERGYRGITPELSTTGGLGCIGLRTGRSYLKSEQLNRPCQRRH